MTQTIDQVQGTTDPAAARRDHALTLAAELRSGYLAGSWREAASTFDVTDPATGAVVASVADCDVADGLAALSAADAAAEEWRASTPAERAALLHRVDTAMRADQENLAHLITLETGKTLTEARGEVIYAADYVRWYAEEAVRVHGRSSTAPTGDFQIVTVAEPVGPCLLITPWNVPLAMVTRKLAPAIAAGCTAVVKPAELTPLVTLAFARIVEDAGAPQGVVSVITTTRADEVCAALLADERLRKVSFTGSTAVGRLLLERSGQRVLRTSMELGGNAPFVVFDDADLDLAVEQAMIAKMRMGGQSCVGANRFLVQEGIADAFAARLGERMAATRVGSGFDEDVDLGPLIDERAVAKAQRLTDDALERGAREVARAEAPEGSCYLAPVVLDQVPADAAIISEEVFAPVAAISTFSTEAEALARANDTEHGLAGFVITASLDRARRMAGRMRSGMVGINRGLVSSVAAPFGGTKQSGLGREGGPEGIAEYLDMKYVAVPAFG
ncbi:NAD-dependent succinate-semialdehyde dehydrogenase [Ruania alba]|uniref:Succinate-semialdehyde dehydrogenase / glutarate-semialdehyde dehydrogenase n=1 Tax=Ruania alba TaxID=648782 RepID=A0A1H5HP88_9MICO|nr:NAD-dependent succinate-semialdehyde dehydrogenase [Ruania alba]SEE29803.1 succinate-semialdehyde dehydrogenase / glutarate-semialdehyde dehydrogenase [Ruania alba]